MSDELDIEAIEARLNAATPGPWSFRLDRDKKAAVRNWRAIYAEETRKAVVVEDYYEGTFAGETFTNCGVRMSESDAALIAHAPEDLCALLAEVRRLREDLADLADLRANVNALGRLLSAPDSPLPADIRARVKPGASIVLSARDLLLDVARERDEARAALQSARRSHRADLLTIGAVVGLPEGEADIGYICDRIQRTQAEVRAARVAGARVMQVEAVRVCTMVADHSVGLHTEPGPVGARMASREIRALDPAAVVGSGS